MHRTSGLHPQHPQQTPSGQINSGVSFDMLASNRGIIFAFIAALILLGAAQPTQPPAQREQPQATASPQQPARPTDLAGPDREPNNPSCERGVDNRESDLCAQWKAADAARNSADWAWIQLILSALGVIGLGLTLWFNFRAINLSEKSAAETKEALQIARDNAEATRKSNDIARDFADAQLRAYLRIDVLQIDPPETLRNGLFFVNVKNYGSTPALNAQFETAYFIADHPITEHPQGIKWQQAGYGAVVHFGRPARCGGKLALSTEEIRAVTGRNAPRRLYLIAKCSYTDAFGGSHIEQLCTAVDFTDGDHKPYMETARFGNISN